MIRAATVRGRPTRCDRRPCFCLGWRAWSTRGTHISSEQVAAGWLREGAAAAASVSPGIVNILDLGSSTGKNSARELKIAVETIQQCQVRTVVTD